MNYIELAFTSITLVLAFFAFKDFPYELSLVQSLKKGMDLPEQIKNFPIHETSLEKYSSSVSKLEYFLDNIENGVPSILNISKSDINDIHLKGRSIDISQILFSGPYIMDVIENDFFYFNILNNEIVIRRINYPKFFSGKKGVMTETVILRYTKHEGKNVEIKKIIEVNSNDMSQMCDGKYDFFGNISGMYLKTTEIVDSSFLFHVFGALEHLDYSPQNFSDSFNYRRLKTLLERVDSVEVIDDYLVIKYGCGNIVND
jgi:hypothetical protein